MMLCLLPIIAGVVVSVQSDQADFAPLGVLAALCAVLAMSTKAVVNKIAKQNYKVARLLVCLLFTSLRFALLRWCWLGRQQQNACTCPASIFKPPSTRSRRRGPSGRDSGG
jgi:drug/metabolite transporter (DMT)-like permease